MQYLRALTMLQSNIFLIVERLLNQHEILTSKPSRKALCTLIETLRRVGEAFNTFAKPPAAVAIVKPTKARERRGRRA